MESLDDRDGHVEMARNKVDALLGLIRAQEEWADVLQVFADATTTEDAQRRLVADLGFTHLQASVVSSMHFFRLTDAERELSGRRLDEARRALDAALADTGDSPRTRA